MRVLRHAVQQARESNPVLYQTLDDLDLVRLKDDVRRYAFGGETVGEHTADEGAVLHDNQVLPVEIREPKRLARGQRRIRRHAGDKLGAGHREGIQRGGNVRQDDDAEVQFPGFEVFPDGHRAFLVKADGKPGIGFLEIRADAREQIGADHRRNADADVAFGKVFVIVQLAHGVVQDVEGILDAAQENLALGGQQELLLAAVEKPQAETGFQLLDGDGDVRLGDFQLGGGAGQVPQLCGHTKILELPKLHGDLAHFLLTHFLS